MEGEGQRRALTPDPSWKGRLFRGLCVGLSNGLVSPLKDAPCVEAFWKVVNNDVCSSRYATTKRLDWSLTLKPRV